ncbi:MAG: deoxyribodipyrimidine photo-lyase, partial [Pseudomonadota bacterium]
MTVDKRRVIILNDTAPRENGRYVLYFMQHSQRALDNPALEHAASLANALDAPLRVLFVLDPTYPEANQRHFSFLIQGLVDVREDLKQRGAWFTLKIGSPVDEVVSLAADAAVVVTDRGYLRHLVKWRASIATHCQCRMEMVEGDVIVPTEAASTKREVGARTLRPKLHRLVPEFSEPITPVPLKRRVPSAAGNDDGHHLLDEPAQLLDSLGVSASVLPVKAFRGGSRAAAERLKNFVAGALRQYGTGRADIVTRRLSKLSPYLHLGQISPVTIYRTIKDATAGADNEA